MLMRARRYFFASTVPPCETAGRFPCDLVQPGFCRLRILPPQLSRARRNVKNLISSVRATLCGRPFSNEGTRVRAATQGRPYNQIDFFTAHLIGCSRANPFQDRLVRWRILFPANSSFMRARSSHSLLGTTGVGRLYGQKALLRM